MISTLLKIFLIGTFAFVFWQDSKDRLVYWFLYPFIGVLGFAIQALMTTKYLAAINAIINLCFIFTLLTVGYLYSRFVMRRDFINGTMGLGDILLFIFLCFTFSIVPFMILLVFSMIFSLLLHQYFKNKSEHKNVPLAGYISIFYAAIYFVSFFLEPKYLFA